MRRATVTAGGLLAAVCLCVLFAVNVYRAVTQSITVDEAFTYLKFVAPPLKAMSAFYDANNHVLNTLLAKAAVHLLGASEFTVRLPSLLGGLAYLAALWLVCRRLFGQGGWFLLAVALNSLNPFLLDYLSAARGYSMALGLWIWALYLLLEGWGGLRRLALAGVLMGFSIAANLVFLVPCLALVTSFALISSADEWRSAGAPAALRRMLTGVAAPLLPAAAVAGAILWWPLQSAQRANFYWGSLNSKDALRSLTESLFFHGHTVVNSQPSIEPLLRRAPYWMIVAGVLALAAVTLWDVFRWLLARRPREQGTAHCLIPGTLFVSVLALVILRRGFGILYPGPRTGIYFLPLLSLACVWLLARIDGPRLLRRAAALVAALPALGALVQFALQFNTAYYFDFREDAGARRIVARLGELRRRAALERVRVGVSPVLSHSYDFYRQTQGIRWLELGRLDGSACMFDYYAFLPAAHESVLPKYRLSVNYHDEISGVTLARFDAALVPQVEELRTLGYRDEIPCRVDFAAVGPVADLSRPDGPAHLLRDFLAAGEFPDRAWAAEKPVLVLRVPDGDRPELVVDFLVHSQVLAQVGPQTLTFRLNGKALDQVRYGTEGRRAYRRPVPAGRVRPGSLALVEMEADKCFVSPLDGQKLSVLFYRVALAPR